MDASCEDDTANDELPGFGDGPDEIVRDVLEVDSAIVDAGPLFPRSRSEPEQERVAPPADTVLHGDFNFDNLLAHAIQNVTVNAVVLPWETDGWACIFDPRREPLDSFVPQFEPKLKIP